MHFMGLVESWIETGYEKLHTLKQHSCNCNHWSNNGSAGSLSRSHRMFKRSKWTARARVREHASLVSCCCHITVQLSHCCDLVQSNFETFNFANCFFNWLKKNPHETKVLNKSAGVSSFIVVWKKTEQISFCCTEIDFVMSLVDGSNSGRTSLLFVFPTGTRANSQWHTRGSQESHSSGNKVTNGNKSQTPFLVEQNWMHHVWKMTSHIISSCFWCLPPPHNLAHMTSAAGHHNLTKKLHEQTLGLPSLCLMWCGSGLFKLWCQAIAAEVFVICHCSGINVSCALSWHATAKNMTCTWTICSQFLHHWEQRAFEKLVYGVATNCFFLISQMQDIQWFNNHKSSVAN